MRNCETKVLLAKYNIPRPECGWSPCEGWYGILDSLIKDLLELGWDKDLRQCKEKFGGLRFYIGPASKTINMRVALAEIDSQAVCCRCGKFQILPDAKLVQVGFYKYCQSCTETLAVKDALHLVDFELKKIRRNTKNVK